MSELYQILPPGAVPFGLLAIGEDFKRLVRNTGTIGISVYRKVEEEIASGMPDNVDLWVSPWELVRPIAPAPGDNTTIVEDIRRQPAPVCVCSNCAVLLDPGECGCLCRVCSTAGAIARPRPIRRFLLYLCPCCSANVGSMDNWCSTCGQPLRAPANAVPF